MEEKSAIHNEIRMSVGRSMGLFYADEGLIGPQDPEWLQEILSIFIGLFHRVGLMANIAKYNTMACQSRAILTRMS